MISRFLMEVDVCPRYGHCAGGPRLLQFQSHGGKSLPPSPAAGYDTSILPSTYPGPRPLRLLYSRKGELVVRPSAQTWLSAFGALGLLAIPSARSADPIAPE